jgi:protein-S-isoprenylcysteine O-methyltransferase Ste14
LRFVDWAVAILTLSTAMLLRPAVFVQTQMTFLSALLQYVGIAGIIASLLSLGRSFGIVPANRKVVHTGMYRFIRHPMYISEILFYLGFVLGNATPRNFVLILLILSGQIWRAVSEETLLSSDPSYHMYMQRVRYRFIPGVF